MIKTELEEKLAHVIRAAELPLSSTFFLEVPTNREYGDFATNLSFSLAKSLKKSPKLIAEEVCDLFSSSEEFQNKIEFIPVNGFINLKLKDSMLWTFFATFLDNDPKFKQVKDSVLLEFVSANPTGPLHIGHGRWAVIGDVLARLLRYVGISVSTEFYINDAGNQVALFQKSVQAVRDLKPIPDNGYHGHYIKDLAKKNMDPLESIILNQKNTLRDLNVKFNTWFYETSLHKSEKVIKTLEALAAKQLTYEKDEALWFKSSDYGDDKDRVLRKKDGELTYFAVDIAYHYDKFNRGFSDLINIWGADHHGYINRVKAAITAISQPQHHLKVMIGQLVTLMRNGTPIRMSKRTGEMITLREVIDEIGVDATRFFMTHKSPDTHLQFDLELAKKKSNENPIFYIQYAHARLKSIQRKLDNAKSSEQEIKDIRLDDKERQLIFHCLSLYDELFSASQALAPHRIAQYTVDLARLVHGFYEACPIIKAEKADQKKRLIILFQVEKVLKILGGILGVNMPDRM